MTDVRREGFSLMEVILAMSILLGGVVVLGRLASIGAKHARTAEDLAAAQLLCEARITEILAGIAPAETLEEELLPLEQPGVVALSVTVTRAPEDLAGLATAPTEEKKEVSVTLVRWMLDPSIAQFGSAASGSSSAAGAISP